MEFHDLVYKTLLQLDSKKENRREIEELGEILNGKFSDEPLLYSLDEKFKASLFRGIPSFSPDGVKWFTHALKNRYSANRSGRLEIPLHLIPEKAFVTSLINTIETLIKKTPPLYNPKILVYNHCLIDLKKISSAFDAAEKSLSVKSE